MAFRHFHKHSRTYMTFAFAAMLFSLFTFNITSAIRSWADKASGRDVSSAFVTFQTASNRTVNLSRNEYLSLMNEIRGLSMLFYPIDLGTAMSQSQMVDDPESGKLATLFLSGTYEPNDPADLHMVHAILLEEAKDLKIEVPDEMLERARQGLLYFVSRQSGGKAITEGEYKLMLRQQGLTEGRFKVRLAEAMKIAIYRNAVAPTKGITNPQETYETFCAQNELVSLDFVAFPFKAAREKLAATPPAEEELKTYYASLDAATIQEKFTRPESYTLDIASIDYTTANFDTLPEGTLANYKEPTADELLGAYRFDPSRYGNLNPSPQKGEELPEETKNKIIADRKMKQVLLKARQEYESWLKTTETEVTPPPDGEKPAEEPTPELSEEQEIAHRAKFEELTKTYGFTVARHESIPRDQLSTLDPPSDRSLEFIVGGLQKPGRIQSVEAARDRKHGYIVRLVKKSPPGTKDFAEVAEAVLAHWLDDKAHKAAEEEARTFRNQVRDRAIARGNLADRVSGIHEEREQKLKEIEANAALSDEDKKERREALEGIYFSYVGSVLGVAEAPSYEELARESNLEIKTLPHFRRSISSTPFFAERFEGAEGFLMKQNGGPMDEGPRLLGYATGTVSEVLVDEEGSAVYVARMLDRRQPQVSEMTPKDVEESHRKFETELRQRRSVAYMNPFSMLMLKSVHHPKVMILDPEFFNREMPEMPPY